MRIEIVTLFPGYFDSIVKQSIVGKGIENRLFDIRIIDLRDFATDRHRTTDDTPYGGGGGMVLKAEPMFSCLKSLGFEKPSREGERIVLTSAAGGAFTQEKAVEFSLLDRLTIICGHYLGVDERILSLFGIEEVSIGDYVMTGGEAAAAVMIDAVTRLIPGVLGNFESALADSHVEKLLGAPVYTKPEEFMGLKVPGPLLSGNHRLIEQFRRRESIRKTFLNRPELLDEAELDKDDLDFINELKKENAERADR
ncbi:MAG: tRNA (guanosine(37)-N1)-methyltransferase TrmD [Candidatus Zixiibacteriota bacterium]|nr:MAG: tRNA (guanosine(37)-N1)-methyltransferase TrmD [candidate division Zixibacteria bacterium]